MQQQNRYISFFIYVLMGYAIMQFFWWTYLIFELNAEIISLQKQIIIFGSDIAEQQKMRLINDLDAVFAKKKLMIAGEGGVFLLILLTGFYLIKRAHNKELALAKQEQNFMLAVTHELNSPLAAIKLNIETLTKRSLPMDKVKMVLGRTYQESERLHFLVNNILAASRMEKKGFELFPELVDLKVQTQLLVDKYQSAVPNEIILTADGDCNAEIDLLGFELIFQNLLENAAKYSDDQIEVSLKGGEGKIICSVADKGIGIPDHEKGKVLAKFYRVGSESTRKSKGTGLGLYLVNNMVKEMKGTLIIKDNVPQGTIFSVTLPN